MKTSAKVFVCLCLALLIFGFSTQEVFSKPPDELMGRDLEKAKRLYQRAIRSGDTSYTIHYAEALYYAGMYDQAYQMFEQADQAGLVTSASQKRNYVHSGRLLGKPVPYAIDTGYFSHDLNMRVNVRPFCANSSNEDFGPIVWNNILFISSSRRQTNVNYSFTQKPYLNIHAFVNDCIQIDIPDYLPAGLNTSMHDGPMTISSDGRMLIITRNYPEPTPEGVYNLYLDYYLKQNNAWSSKQLFPFVDAKYSFQHPYYNEKDSLLYFSSNMPGGHGGFDLYSSKWDGQQWQPPVNLGSLINSEFDEVFPSVDPGGSLIYASNHLQTRGGLDLVMLRDSIRFLFPEPINSVYDDFSISFKDERSGYFSSSRNPGAFNDDIFYFEILKDPLPEHEYFLEVLDKQTNNPISDVQVRFFSVEAQAQGLLLTNEQGLGFVHRGRQDKYKFVFDLYKTGYASLNLTSSDFIEKDGRYVLTLYMHAEKLPVDKLGEEARLAGYFVVYFDNDQPDPRSTDVTTTFSYEQTFYAYMLKRAEFFEKSISGRAELDQFFSDVEKGMVQLRWLADFLAEELRAGRHYTIVFTSHASPLANSSYNLALSKRRFTSVENFIRSWNGGSLVEFVDNGYLNYENNPFGSSQASAWISADRNNPSRSIYSVEASRERKVTISWKRNDEHGSDVIKPFGGPENSLNNPSDMAPPDRSAASAPAIEKSMPIHIIVGSFENFRDASSLASRLQSQGIETVKVLLPEQGSTFRVSYKGYSTIEAANRALTEVRKEIRADAWILRN